MNSKEPALYTIAKRPKEDLSDNEEYIPSKATINLLLFKGDLTNCHEVKGKGTIVRRCGALLRLSECMRYMDVVKKQFGEGISRKKLADFVVNSYDVITEDFAHFVVKHQNDFDEIAETLRTMGYIDGICDVAKCANLRRHCTRNRRAKGTANQHDVHVEYAVDVMDQYHRMVFHLYDMGLRVRKEEVSEMKEVEDMGSVAVDKKLESERDFIAKKKKEFAAAAPDIVEESEGGNKFVIGGVVSTRECITDSICREIEKMHDEAAVVELEEYRMKNEFDSEIIEEDVGDLNDSNFANDLKQKMVVKSLRNLVVKIQKHLNELATGMRFKYWKDDVDMDSHANKRIARVHPKFGNLKEEMKNSPFMSTDKWNLIVFKAQKLFKSKFARAMKVNEYDDENAGTFDVKNGDKVTVYHFQCVCLYTDESDLCTDFGGSLRQANGLESVESVVDRNSSYYHLSRGLIEAVQLFGATNETESGPFYTGLSREFVLSSFCVKFVGPTSTSTEMAIALHFADERGVVIQVNNDTSNLAKCLNVSWCSRYPEESERLFMASRMGLRVASVILVKTATNFAKYFSAMFKLDAMLSRARIKPLSVSSKDVKIIEKLCANQLTSVSKSGQVPPYISECFHLWCQRKEQIDIQIWNLVEQYDGLRQMIMTKLVGVDDDGNVKDSDSLQEVNCIRPRIFKMFPNLKRVWILTRRGDSNVLQYPIPLKKFLEFMCEVGVSAEYKILAFSDRKGTVATWLHNSVTKEVEQKFEEKGWKIEKSLNTQFKRLAFRNVY